MTRLTQNGRAGLRVNLVAGQSTAVEVWSTSPIKLLTPWARGPSVWAYLSSLGGGFVAGDEIIVKLRVGECARCFLTTQASTKVYRNLAGRPCGHDLSAQLEENSLLVLAPDPVQPFAESSYRQTQRFHLHHNAGLVLLDWFCSGRAACGERWSFNRLQSRNEIFIDEECCLFDSLLLDRAHGTMAGAHRLGRFNCVAMLAVVGRPLNEYARALLDTARDESITERASLIFSASPIRGGTLLRVAGEQFENVARFVYRSLGFVGGLLGDDPWLRKLHTMAGAN